MQKINYKEKIELNDTIKELLLINIDDRLEQNKENDCIKVTGEIKISGEANTNSGEQNFFHQIDVDILLSREQLLDDNVEVSIEDFNYQLDNNSILIDLIMKIDGLKEIEAYFPADEDKTPAEETIEETQYLEIEKTETIEDQLKREEISESEENNNSQINELMDEDNTQAEDEIIISKDECSLETEENPECDLDTDKASYSLLKQVFRNKVPKKEISYLLHVVKEENSYEEIAKVYNIDASQIKNANNDEEIYKGKLIFIPKN